MEIFKQIFTNPVLLVPLGTWIFSQLVKAVVNFCICRKFSLERLFGDGGMPSAHSATVMALMIMVGHTMGFGSPVFAFAFIFAAVVMHDATGVRREAGKQAVTLKKLALIVNDAVSDPDKRIRTEKLKVLVGHTPLQVVCGALLGIAVSLVYHFLIK